MLREELYQVSLVNMRFEENKGRGIPKKRWKNCKSKDLREKNLGEVRFIMDRLEESGNADLA